MSEEVYVIKESLDAASEKEAQKACVFSRNTMAVAAAATSGAKVKEYNRTVERTLTGAKNVVAFALEEKEIDFSPDFAPERIKTSEVLRRMRDEEWLQANPSHPIAYMAFALDTYKRLIFIIKEKSPILVIPQGGKNAALHLSLRGDRDYQRRLMKQAKLTDEEIENVIAQLDAGSGKK